MHLCTCGNARVLHICKEVGLACFVQGAMWLSELKCMKRIIKI